MTRYHSGHRTASYHRRRWPPPPRVEDETVSLSREVPSSRASTSSSDIEIPARGEIDQNPIILDALPRNNKDVLTPDGSSVQSMSSLESMGPVTPPPNSDRRFVYIPHDVTGPPLRENLRRNPEDRAERDVSPKGHIRDEQMSRGRRPEIAPINTGLGADLHGLVTGQRRAPSPYAFTKQNDSARDRSTTREAQSGDYLLSPEAITPKAEFSSQTYRRSASARPPSTKERRRESEERRQRHSDGRRSARPCSPSSEQSNSDASSQAYQERQRSKRVSFHQDEPSASPRVEHYESPRTERWSRKSNDEGIDPRMRSRPPPVHRVSLQGPFSKDYYMVRPEQPVNPSSGSAYESQKREEDKHSADHSYPVGTTISGSRSPREPSTPVRDRFSERTSKRDSYSSSEELKVESNYRLKPQDPARVRPEHSRHHSTTAIPRPPLETARTRNSYQGGVNPIYTEDSRYDRERESHRVSRNLDEGYSSVPSTPQRNSRQYEADLLKPHHVTSRPRSRSRGDSDANYRQATKEEQILRTTTRSATLLPAFVAADSVLRRDTLNVTENIRPRAPSRSRSSTVNSVSSSPQTSRFPPSTPTTSETIPRISTPRLQGMHVGNCPRPNLTSGYQDWYTIRGLSHINICPSCLKHINSSPFAAFVIPSTYRSSMIPIKCAFSDPWVKLAWSETHKQRLLSLKMLDRLTLLLQGSPCPNNELVSRKWYRVTDPENGRTISSSFSACRTCVRALEIMMPQLELVFQPSASAHEGYCDLRSDSRRFPKFIGHLSSVALDYDMNRLRYPDMRPFVNYARHANRQEECPRDIIRYGAPWHFMPSFPEFTVCEECYNEVIEPYSTEPIACLFSRNLQLLPGPGPNSEKGSTCQMYSERMRDKLADAIKFDDLESLKGAVRRRSNVEKLLKEKMAIAKADLQKGHLSREIDLKEAEEEWRRWE